MNVLQLPVELSTLILGYLELGDLLRFCATSREIRLAFRPGAFIFLLAHFEEGHPRREQAIDECGFLLRCHALCILFRRHLLRKDLHLLTQRGASFRHVPHGRLIEGVFLRFGHGKKLKFMLDHGASLPLTHEGDGSLLERNKRVRKHVHEIRSLIRRYPLQRNRSKWFMFDTRKLMSLDHSLMVTNCDKEPPVRSLRLLHLGGLSERAFNSLHALLADIYLDVGAGSGVEVLFDYGADVRHVPRGIHGLLELALLKWGLDETVNDLMSRGADFKLVPSGLNALLEATFLNFGCSPEVNHLVEKEQASFLAMPSTMEEVLQKTYVQRRPSKALDYILDQYNELHPDGPKGERKLLEAMFRRFGLHTKLHQFMQRYNVSMQQVPCGIGTLLEDTFRIWGPGRTVKFLLSSGASFQNVPCGLNNLVQEQVLEYGMGPRVIFLMRHGASLDVKSYTQRIKKKLMASDK